MSPGDVSIPSLKRTPPFKPHNQASLRNLTRLSNTPGITICSFPMLFLIFTALLVHVDSAAISSGQPIRAAGGVPGPPAQPGHKSPKKEDPDTPSASIYDLATSTPATASTFIQQSSTTTTAWQMSTSSIAIYPTSSSSSSAVSTPSSSSGSQELTLITTTPTLSSSIPPSSASTVHSTLAVSSAVNPSSTTLSPSPTVANVSSKRPTIPTTTVTSMPTNIAIASTSQYTGKRNQTIILTTVLVPVAFALIASLLLTRCCTRKPHLPPRCLRPRTKSQVPIPDEETPPLELEKPKPTETEREPQDVMAPPAFTAIFSTSVLQSAAQPSPPTPLSTQTATSSPSALSLLSATSFFGLTLPSPTRFPRSPFAPLTSHPPLPTVTVSPPTRHPSLSQHSQLGSAPPSSASSSRSLRSSRSGSRLLPEKRPARFTFGGGADGGAGGGWAWEGGEGVGGERGGGGDGDEG